MSAHLAPILGCKGLAGSAQPARVNYTSLSSSGSGEVLNEVEGRIPTALEMLGICIGADDGGCSPPLHVTALNTSLFSKFQCAKPPFPGRQSS